MRSCSAALDSLRLVVEEALERGVRGAVELRRKAHGVVELTRERRRQAACFDAGDASETPGRQRPGRLATVPNSIDGGLHHGRVSPAIQSP